MNKRSAVFFDLDGTWFRWQFFHEVIKQLVAEGLMAQIVLSSADEALQRYLDRKGSFDDWARQQVSAYHGAVRGLRVRDLQDVARKVVKEKGQREHVFVRELSNAARDMGYARAIISGSMHEAVQIFAETREIEIALGSEYPHENGTYTGDAPTQWCQVKDQAISLLAERHDLDLGESIAIGDTLSDGKMLGLVPWPLCFRPHAPLKRFARLRQWPIVSECKDDFTVMRADRFGMLHEVKLDTVLPKDLADRLLERLRSCAHGDHTETFH